VALEWPIYVSVRCRGAARSVSIVSPYAGWPPGVTWLGECRPHLRGRIAFVTGDALGAGSAGFIARSGRPFREKPFVPAELRRLTADLVPDTGSD
jgi:hypothetical protein